MSEQKYKIWKKEHERIILWIILPLTLLGICTKLYLQKERLDKYNIEINKIYEDMRQENEQHREELKLSMVKWELSDRIKDSEKSLKKMHQDKKDAEKDLEIEKIKRDMAKKNLEIIELKLEIARLKLEQDNNLRKSYNSLQRLRNSLQKTHFHCTNIVSELNEINQSTESLKKDESSNSPKVYE